MKRIKATRMPRLLRRIAAAICLLLSMTFFIAAGTSLALDLKWIARVQIVPLILSVSVSMIAFWALFTFLFGRLYCSVICPMGTLMDIAARLPRMSRRAALKRRYLYTQPRNSLRYGWLAVVVVATLLGISTLLALFDPYGAFGRIMSYIIVPLLRVGAGMTVVGGTVAGISVAVITLLIVVIVAERSGRTICNTFCPVGSALSLVSRHSIFGIDINTDTCVGCGLCGLVCKSHCIDTKAHTVDTSRCVVCFDCIDICDAGAITYTNRRHRLSMPLLMRAKQPGIAATMDAPTMNMSRRRFITSGLTLAAAPAVMEADELARRTDAIIIEHSATPTNRPVFPPGFSSPSSFLTRCVGCGACIEACPAHVLHPSPDVGKIKSAIRPVKNYDTSYCRYDCVRCSQICPTGALEPLTVAEKHTFRVGVASVDPELCISCGLCVKRCPAHTISMVSDGHRFVAHVDTEGCIGCGSCQYICPAVPIRAITVNGLPL